jgi:hypothetical protein
MFEINRTFSINNQNNGNVEWYFQAREGNSGPYSSEEEAQTMLKYFIKERIEQKNTGGRDSNEKQPAQLNLKTGPQVKFKFRPKGIWY